MLRNTRSRRLMMIGGVIMLTIGVWGVLTLVDETPTSLEPVPEEPVPSGAFFFAPPSEPTTIGETITLELRVRSDTPANTYYSTIVFPSDQIEVVGIDETNSIVDLWVEEPEFDNEQGTITFAGGSLLPEGFSGEDTLLQITFMALQPGDAEFVFAESALYAHDGAGTEIPLTYDPFTLSITE